MKSNYSTRKNGASVDSMMTPMIDVVFLLLVFFLATSSFQKLEKALPSSIATAPETQQQGNATQQEQLQNFSDLSDVVIRILSSKNALSPNQVEYTINGESIASLDLLINRMTRILKARSDIPLIIDPEDNVAVGEAIRIYDLAKANGSVSVFMSARSPR